MVEGCRRCGRIGGQRGSTAVIDSMHIEKALELKTPLDRPDLYYYHIIPGLSSTPMDAVNLRGLKAFV